MDLDNTVEQICVEEQQLRLQAKENSYSKFYIYISPQLAMVLKIID